MVGLYPVPALTLKGTDTVNKREQLAQWTSLVADTGDLDMIAELAPEMECVG